MPLSLTPPTAIEMDPAASTLPVLPARLDTPMATLLRDALLDKRNEAVILDGSKVELLGGRCAKVLFSAAKLWAADGASFRIDQPSEAFQRDLALLGLQTEDLSV